MDLFSIVGLVCGFLAVIGAMIFKHIPFSVFLNPAAICVIILGTIASVMIATPASELRNVGKLFGVVFGKPRFIRAAEAITKLVDYSKAARTGGLLALEPQIANETDPFLIRGLQLLVDGTDKRKIEEYLNEDIYAMQQRHAGNAQVFSQAGSYAPTLGVLGAVMGLIAALGDLSDMDRLSHAISAAFIATVLGIFTGYVLWHPMANKLKGKSRQEVQVRSLIVTGICSIAEGQNPNILQENLLGYLTAKERTAYQGGPADGKKTARTS